MPHLEPQDKSLITLRRAFYIKLGRGGLWEADSLANNIMRIGWTDSPLADINSQNWDAIEHKLRANLSHQGTATRDYNALKEIVASNEEDVWITFQKSRLWWCRLSEGPLKWILSRNSAAFAGDGPIVTSTGGSCSSRTSRGVYGKCRDLKARSVQYERRRA